jgi:hypothetical protein
VAVTGPEPAGAGRRQKIEPEQRIMRRAGGTRLDYSK